MATETVADHVELARNFLERSKSYLAQGDLYQASEKGWGAASHIVKAAAAANNWKYEYHDQFDSVVINARQRYRQPGIRQYGNSAQSLHRNYYKRDLLLNASIIQEEIDDVERMVNILEPFLV